ncbi:MAG: helix-turn-helix transcriptional regulator [Treponema sp.]|nr:helix-turn-helix transcriptional regulator [Treponema sp.]
MLAKYRGICYYLPREGLSLAYDFEINKRIVQIRKALAYSQEKFAKGIAVSRSFQGGIEANHRKVNDRLGKMICLTYGVSEKWLHSGEGTMFDTEKDPRLERIIRNFNKMDPLLRDYVVKYLDWLVEYYETRPEPGA